MNMLQSRFSRMVLLLVLVASQAPKADIIDPVVGDTKEMTWEPTVLTFSPECASTFWQSRRTTSCIIEPVIDSSGNLHVFLVQRPLGRNVQVDRHIEHLVLSDNTVHQLPSIPLANAPAIALRAVATQTGELHLLWAEDEYFAPKHHDQAIYLESYRDDTWNNRRAVLDEHAQPFILGQHDLALSANEDGSVDVFWRDLREYHFLADLVTMGHAGNYAKTYHRRLTGNDRSETERVQHRGAFEPYAFRILPTAHGWPDVFWSETSGSTATIVRSAYSRGRWAVEETIGRCKSSLGQPQVLDLDLSRDINGTSRVAWVCSRYEATEPGTPKNDLFSNLYVSTLLKGTWTTGPILARNTSYFQWLSNETAEGVLLVQESSPRTRFWKPSPVPLYLESIDANHLVDKRIFSERSIEGAVESAADSTGRVNVIYAEPISDTEATLKCRRGKHHGS